MGLQIGDIVPRQAIDFSQLKGKIVAVDAFNVIYQFLSSIRQQDGTPLMDSKRNVTSHLSGLFYRNVSLLQDGLKLVYVFDGKQPELKARTQEKRQMAKDEAWEKYEQARSEEDVEAMGKYAKSLTRLTPEMLEESKELLNALGIAVIQAPGEGEAEAARLVTQHKLFAVASQDYDSLLFGATRLIQNLTLARKRKTSGGNWVFISPEVIELEKVLNNLGINLEQLRCLGVLVGTDYNPGGIKGIGQKKALELVKKYVYPVQIFKAVEDKMDFDWQQIFSMFSKPDVEDFDIKFPELNEKKVREILLKREFSEDRIESALAKLRTASESRKQKTLF